MRKLLIRASLVAALFVQGAILGSLCFLLLREQPLAARVAGAGSLAATEDRKDPTPSPSDAPDGGPGLTPDRHRQIGEEFLRRGAAFEALSHFVAAAPEDLEQADQDLIFRLALCYEYSGDVTNSSRLYRQLMDTAEDASTAFAARLGFCRCALQNRNFPQVQNLLWPALLIGDDPSMPPIYSDAVFLLVSALGRQNTTEETPDDEYPASLIDVDIRFSPERQLQRLIESREFKAPPGSTQTPASTVQVDNSFRVGDRSAEVVFDIQAQSIDLIELLQWISENLQVPISVTEEAVGLLNHRRMTLYLSGIELPTILDAVTVGHGLSWLDTKDGIVIRTDLEAPADSIEDMRVTAAQRLVRRALMRSPDHYLLDEARLMLGTLLCRRGTLSESVPVLEEAAAETRGVLNAIASYNLATAYAQLGFHQQAIDALNRVVESNAPLSMQSDAYVRLGTLLFDRGEIPQAVRVLSRGLQTAVGEKRQIAAILLASAHLLGQQPRAASRVVFENRQYIQRPQYRQYAAIMSYLAEYFIDGSEMSEKKRIEMLSTLAGAEPPERIGVQANLVIARAFKSLGFYEQAANVLNDGLDLASDTWVQDQLRDELVAQLILVGQTDRARALLGDQMSDSSAVSVVGMIQLARLEYEAGELDESLRRLQQMLRLDVDEETRAEALSIMGKIFQHRGLHRHAALCFAGLLPSD